MKWISCFRIICAAILALVSSQTSCKVINSTVLYTISSVNSSVCIGGQKVGLTDTSIKLEYREVFDCGANLSLRQWKQAAVIPVEDNGVQNVVISYPEAVQGIQLRLLQLEHGGGGCNCWELEELEFTFGSGQTAQISLMNNE